MLESYLILFFASFVNILRPYTETGGQSLELGLSIMFFILTVAFPIYSGLFLYLNFDELGDRQMKIRYKPLYEELNLDKKWSMIAFRVWFMLRRIAVICALLLTTHLWLQMIIAFAQEIITLIIIGWMNPYDRRGKWRREILNEWFITLTIYHVICFTESNSIEMRTFVGYSFCFLLTIHVLISISFMLFMALKTAFWATKKSYIVKTELAKVEKARNLTENKKRSAMMAMNYTVQREEMQGD